jgi:hypothetical protein
MENDSLEKLIAGQFREVRALATSVASPAEARRDLEHALSVLEQLVQTMIDEFLKSKR